MNKKIHLYALKLANGYFYIGQTSKPAMRFEAHQLGNGALFTKENRPIAIIYSEEIFVNGPREAICHENRLTLQYMQRYGWQNVRGGDFVSPDEKVIREQLQYIYDTNINRIRSYVPDCLFAYGPSDDFIIYVLQLENGRYYIGSGKRLARSLAQHWNGTGSAWTQTHHPLRVLEVKTASNDYREVKKGLLKYYIRQHGAYHVVGGQL